jgi:hypothetical protein
MKAAYSAPTVLHKSLFALLYILFILLKLYNIHIVPALILPNIIS